MPMIERVFLSLGSNLGDRGANLQKALVDLELWGVSVFRSSSMYVTDPFGKKDQPDFYNLAVEVTTDRSPEDLLTAIHAIERSFGRERKEKWGPRTIDIDILFYGDKVMDDPALTIPHPHLAARKFVLVPLHEIASKFVHPILKKTVGELLMECKDEGTVSLLSSIF